MPVTSRLRRASRLLVGGGVECPICGHKDRDFKAHRGRDNARCRNCGSLERHRLLWLWLDRLGPSLTPGTRVAHFAPEPWLEKRFRAMPGLRYSTADIVPGRADEEVDATSIPWEDGSIDVLLCSHVLEHIPDDQAAMREFRRVLSPRGFAILVVPLTHPATVERPDLTDPEERTRLFGQADHVRGYGPDYYDRLAAAGFSIRHVDMRDHTTPEERTRYGLHSRALGGDTESPELWDVPVCLPQLDTA